MSLSNGLFFSRARTCHRRMWSLSRCLSLIWPWSVTLIAWTMLIRSWKARWKYSTNSTWNSKSWFLMMMWYDLIRGKWKVALFICMFTVLSWLELTNNSQSHWPHLSIVHTAKLAKVAFFYKCLSSAWNMFMTLSRCADLSTGIGHLWNIHESHRLLFVPWLLHSDLRTFLCKIDK